MAILKLSENLYISPQLSEADAAQAAKLGIKSVICNRPDDEEAGQPEAAQVRQWLEQAGIAAFRHQPVTAPAITDADIDTFHKLLAELPSPVLAYCRTGTRCSLLWGYRQIQNGSSVAEVKTASARAGVDLTNFEARLQAAADNR